MSINLLAINLRRLRALRKMSQADLSEKSGVSLSTIKKLENEQHEARVTTLQCFAEALGVPLQELFLPVRELKTVRFRSAKKMQNREKVLAEVGRWLDDFSWLETALNRRSRFKLAALHKNREESSVEEKALLCPKELGLMPTEPIHDICGLLESAGVKVMLLSMASDSFFGLSVGEEDGGPAVAVNVWERISVERRIFSAAHELGHLLMHSQAYDVLETEENKNEEAEANLFAGHFLMPDAGFQREWQKAAGLDLVDRVFKVKRIFHVSYKTILYRLIQLGVADSTVWSCFNAAYKRRFNRVLRYKEEPERINPAEPFGLQSIDFNSDRFSRLVREAIESDKISLSRGAEMLGISLKDMRERVAGWEVVAQDRLEERAC